MLGNSRRIINLCYRRVRSNCRKQKMTDLALVGLSAWLSIVSITVMLVVGRITGTLQHESGRSLVWAEFEQ